MTVAEYLRRKNNIYNTTYKKSFYLIKGEWVDEKIWLAENKLPVNLFCGKPNVDTTRDFLYQS